MHVHINHEDVIIQLSHTDFNTLLNAILRATCSAKDDDKLELSTKFGALYQHLMRRS